jgi:hypothetical protein
MKGVGMMPLRTKEENRIALAKVFQDKREILGNRFDQMVDEISEVSYSYMEKHDSLPKVPTGTLDGNAAEERLLEREEATKWVLIKQKYGI